MLMSIAKETFKGNEKIDFVIKEYSGERIRIGYEEKRDNPLESFLKKNRLERANITSIMALKDILVVTVTT